MAAIKKTPFSMRLSTSTRKQLKQEARSANRSESSIAIIAVERYLSLREQERAAIDVAIKKADHGKFISQEAVGAWVDSWGTDHELAPPDVDIKIKK